MHIQNLMNSLLDIRIFLSLVPKESHCIKTSNFHIRTAHLDITNVLFIHQLVH